MARRSGRKTKGSGRLGTALSIGNISLQEQKNNRPLKRNSLTIANALHTNSAILKADIQSLFAATIKTWSSLPDERRRLLIDVFPPAYRVYDREDNGSLKCPISEKFVANDNIIKRDVARFKRDVENGFYLKKWQEDGKKAMSERAQGRFDEYVVQRAEDYFGARRGAQQSYEMDHAS